MENKTENKKNTVGFWKREGQYGEYYLSKEVDAATYEQFMQQLEIGGRLVIDAVTSDNPNAPQYRLKVLPKRNEPATAKTTARTPTPAKRATPAPSDIG